MNIRRVLVAAVILAVAVSGFALTPEHTEFGKGPASYFFTKQDAAQWKQIKTDEEAEKFIALFWARRDPTPGTAKNEFRDEFDRRVAMADKEFKTRRGKRGSMTDRGKVIVTLGPPPKMSKSTNEAVRLNPNDLQNAEDEAAPRQVWSWDGARANELFGKNQVTISFTDTSRTGEFAMDLGGGTNDVRRAQDRITAAALTQPNLTEVPPAGAAAPAAPAAPTAAVVAATSPASPTAALAFKNESFKAAVDEFRGGKSKMPQAAVTYTEFLSHGGDYFVPVQLYIPKSAGLTADSVTTFFGVVEDASGQTVSVFEEPAKLSASKGDLYFDRSLTLQPGTYKATLGLSGADNKPVVMATQAIELKDVNKDTHGISRMILATDIHETAEAAPAGAPYAFGKLKIVPKGDRVFSNKDDLTYVLELLGFGVDEGTNLPKVQVKLDLSGKKASDGKAIPTISAPMTESAAMPLSGQPGPGSYLVVSTIPLGEMGSALPAGDYTLKIKVYDQIKKQNFTAEQSFKLVEAPKS